MYKSSEPIRSLHSVQRDWLRALVHSPQSITRSLQDNTLQCKSYISYPLDLNNQTLVYTFDLQPCDPFPESALHQQRIQDFPQGKARTQSGAPTHYLAKIAKNCFKKLGPGGGTRPKFYYVDPSLCIIVN